MAVLWRRRLAAAAASLKTAARGARKSVALNSGGISATASWRKRAARKHYRGAAAAPAAATLALA
jgi:hypothetical protein